MNDETKLALMSLAAMAVGCALIVSDLWPHYRVAAVFVGILCFIGGAICFAAIWRGR